MVAVSCFRKAGDEPEGGEAEGTGQRAPQGYQDVAEGYCWAPGGGWMERKNL
ncbi:hypothetical protein K0M31_009631 [Melipona bicolor]|uniref:Uncharacterized protein n=1 Tax=Melipona bicolor TaxID=60889 RepID=A0AA40FNG2_9HYME|nr:hypothetical protein K0M31_009631 [Melipona bicolor]